MRYCKAIIVISLIICGIQFKSVGQIIKGEAILGLNMTQVEGDEVHGFKKPGLQIGVGALIPFKNKWDISMEVLYNQKGATQRAQYQNDTLSSGEIENGQYKIRLNYVEVPILVHFTDKGFLTFGAGFSWARLVGIQEWEHGNRVETTTLTSDTYNKNDFSYIIDVRIKILGPLKFGIRYQNSMVKIRTRDYVNKIGDTWSRDQYNKVLTFKLVYIFNEEQSKSNKNAPKP